MLEIASICNVEHDADFHIREKLKIAFISTIRRKSCFFLEARCAIEQVCLQKRSIDYPSGAATCASRGITDYSHFLVGVHVIDVKCTTQYGWIKEPLNEWVTVSGIAERRRRASQVGHNYLLFVACAQSAERSLRWSISQAAAKYVRSAHASPH